MYYPSTIKCINTDNINLQKFSDQQQQKYKIYLCFNSAWYILDLVVYITLIEIKFWVATKRVGTVELQVIPCE